MKRIAYLLEVYESIPMHDFSRRIINAIGILVSERKVNNKAIREIEWIRDNTHSKLRVSIYTLDFVLNPNSKSVVTEFNQKIRLRTNLKDRQTGQVKEIELPVYMFNEYLYRAIEKVYMILSEATKDYAVDRKIPRDDDDDTA